jgi:outer membrane protein assembly factor BamB/dienelactone hydrolase
MRDARRAVLAALLILAASAPLLAAGRGKAVAYDNGHVYVPVRPADGCPIIVIVEYASRANQLIETMKPGLKKFGVIAIAPKLPMTGRQLEAEKGWAPTAKLLDRIRDEFKLKPGKLYTLGFSATGQMAYKLAFTDPAKFAGIVAVNTLPPKLPKKPTDAQKKLPVRLVYADGDAMFGKRFATQAQKALAAAGFAVTVKNTPGGHFSPLSKYPESFMEWVTGGKAVVVPPDQMSESAKALAKAHRLAVKWRKPLKFGILSAPVVIDGRIAIYGKDGAVHVLTPAKGVEEKVIPVAKSRSGSGNYRPGAACGSMLVLPVHTKSGGTEPDTLVGIDVAAGKVAWRVSNPPGVLSAVGAGGTYFGFGSHDTQFHLCNAKNGSEKWKTKTGVSCASSGRFGKGVVYFGGTAGVFARDIKTGAERWSKKIPLPFGQDTMALNEASGVLLVGSGKKLVGLATKDGSKLWELELDSACTGAPAVAAGLFICPAGADLVGVDAKGKQVWKITFDDPLVGRPLPTGRGVTVVAGKRLVVLHAGTGRILAASGRTLKLTWGSLRIGRNWIVTIQDGELVMLGLK